MLTKEIVPALPSIEPSNLVPVVRELPADLETPVSVYLKLAGTSPSFLLESVTGGEQVARYSFIGVNPSHAYILKGHAIEHHSDLGIETYHLANGQDPLDYLRAELGQYRLASSPGLPRFAGGLVGYLGYEASSHFEASLPTLSNKSGDGSSTMPDAIFLLADTLVAFDHAYGRLLLITNVPAGAAEQDARREGENRLDELERRISEGLPELPMPLCAASITELRSNSSYEAFTQAVMRAKEYIAAGDIFQVVLSQRFSRRTSASPFDIYRCVRRLNPSPYMFYFDFDGLAGAEPLHLIGASPELHVRLESGRASLRPIAGTRPRGLSTEVDQSLEKELLGDPKERAEHVMLVDLARNDLGRVCQYGSVDVPQLMTVERYSHVMHIVSQVEGHIQPGCDSFDLLRATFPAGTVSGAPKIRAMQIIAELEGEGRGPYAGAVGYFSYDGSMDTCITIRTLVMQGDTISIQSGAGIVADSDPDGEYQETINKARALSIAVEMAENGK